MSRFPCIAALTFALAVQAAVLSGPDEELLDMVERRAFDFFWSEADPATGLVRDQAGNFDPDTEDVRLHRASISSVGFGLSAYCIGAERGWITVSQALERVRATLRTFDTRLERDANGLYYHWIDMRTCRRWMWNERDGSEFSTIDTALFLAGAITAGEYFDAPDVAAAVDRIYRGIRWDALGEGYASFYNEYLLLTLLGMGAPEHAVDPAAWTAMRRDRRDTTATRKDEADFPRLFYPSLFAHLFPQAWFDLRGKHDEFANYFLNSRHSVLANRRYCMDHGPDGIVGRSWRFATYGSNCWGLSACEAPPPKGYEHYGEADPAEDDLPGFGMRGVDGTVAIHAAGGSMPFAPEEALAMLKHLWEAYREELWGRYGFCDSFNADARFRDRFNSPSRTVWRAEVVSGVNQGITLLMIENYRSRLIWRHFMRNEHVRRAMDLAGFVPQRDAPASARIDLSGTWRFAPGDKAGWGNPATDDSAWRLIRVPARWESEGFRGYDGIAWYRKAVSVPRSLASAGRLALRFGAIDDADEVFVNGVRVGGMGDFPPGTASAWDAPRLYALPAKAVRLGATNLVAVRVNDQAAGGGIWRGPVDLVPLDSVQFRPLRLPMQDAGP